MKIVLFDFEVFKHDTLLGTLSINDDGSTTVYQTWDLDDVCKFYETHKNCIWIGHNNAAYDNFILQAIVNGKSSEEVKIVNDNIINKRKRYYLDIQLYYYDLMNAHTYALKTIEAYMGKRISESNVDFNLDRRLTEEEKLLTESYNRDDLSQTYDDFNMLKHEFVLRTDIMNEFKLPIDCLNVTGTRLAEEVLHAKKIPNIEKQVKLPTLWPTLQVKNKEVIDFYLNRDYANKKRLDITLCGTPHTLAAGGIHGAKKKCHLDWAFYFDVSGYYNLIMIKLDLLPRSIPAEYRLYYEDMYHTQLKLKKTNPAKRPAYKTILLSVFGAMNNEYCRFYDPWQGDLVRLSGELYIVDLLEKLEGMVEVIQSNTDGVIAVPINNVKEEDILAVINEWQTRTGYVLKLEKIYDIHQRDVNNYFYRKEDGSIQVVGEAVTHYGKLDAPFWKHSYNAKEPLIIPEAIVNYYMFNKLPEQTIEEKKRVLRMFQYICKPLSFDYLTYDLTTSSGTTSEKLQSTNRAFAMKQSEGFGMVYKRKWTGEQAKVSNLPDSVFVYNDEILSDKAVDELIDRIDYDYYIKRAYERILEFKDVKTLKGITL